MGKVEPNESKLGVCTEMPSKVGFSEQRTFVQFEPAAFGSGSGFG